ncbi:MAG: dihydroorotate dehydrogenase [Chloroflexi bacterium]|nr:dihydroorotate dehydrogenase [Chloroflexota bacterium]
MPRLQLAVELAPRSRRRLVLKNPVMTASGTFGYGTEYASMFDVQQLGAIVCKGTTLEPRSGNSQPRLAETPAGMLNSIGLQNIGIEALIREKAPLWATWQVPVIVNIAAERLEDYSRLASLLDGVAGVSGIEVNISCPNVAAGGMEFGTSPQSAAAVTAAVRQVTTLPVIVKLTPNVTDVVPVARAVAQAGADAITAINTLRGMAIDIKRRQPLLGNVFGGLSGPAIKPVALYMVYQVAQAVDIPVIGCGGICSAEAALEFLMAGARAVQVGSAIFQRPRLPLEVLAGIRSYLEQEGIEDVSRIVGLARPRPGQGQLV